MISIAIYSELPHDVITIRSSIQDWLIETHTMAKVSILDNPESFITVPASYDVYIMDMDSPTDTIALGKRMMRIDTNAKFIFIGTDLSIAYKVAKIKGDYFIGKPHKKDELWSTLDEIKSQLKEDNIIIKTPQGDRRVKINMVNYIHIEKRCLCYHLRDGSYFDGHVLRTSFEKAIGPLKNHPMFIFIAPSLLINVSEIKILDNDHLQFENDEVLYFPKKSMAAIKEKWLTYNKI